MPRRPAARSGRRARAEATRIVSVTWKAPAVMTLRCDVARNRLGRVTERSPCRAQSNHLLDLFPISLKDEASSSISRRRGVLRTTISARPLHQRPPFRVDAAGGAAANLALYRV